MIFPVRRLILIAFCVMSLLHGRQARATTVYADAQKCPVCKDTFIRTAIGSYNSFGAKYYDLRHLPVFGLFGGTLMCPYCLYTSMECDFENLSFAERRELRKWTADIDLSLTDLEREILEADGYRRLPTSLILARNAYARRKPDPRIQAQLALAFYYGSSEESDPKLHPVYRRQAIQQIRSTLGANKYDVKERAVMTYLMGELLRLDGQDENALAAFKQASRLSKRKPH